MSRHGLDRRASPFILRGNQARVGGEQLLYRLDIGWHKFSHGSAEYLEQVGGCVCAAVQAEHLFLELRPVRKPVFTGNDELRVLQTERGALDFCLGGSGEFREKRADTMARVDRALAVRLKQLLGLRLKVFKARIGWKLLELHENLLSGIGPGVRIVRQRKKISIVVKKQGRLNLSRGLEVSLLTWD